MAEIPRFDVFISYAHHDLDWAESLHRLLEHKGFVSAFEIFNSSYRHSRDEIFDAVYSSAVCLFLIGSRRTSPWWDDHIREAIDERASNSRNELRVVSVLCSSPAQQFLDWRDYQSILPFESEGMVFSTDSMDDKERLHELILLIRGAERRPFLADSALCKLARVRAKKALGVNWSKRWFSFPLQTEPQLIRFRGSQTQKYFHKPEQRKLSFEPKPDYRLSTSLGMNTLTAQANFSSDIYTQLRRTLNELSRTLTSNVVPFEPKLECAPVIQNPKPDLPVNEFKRCNRGSLYVPLQSSSLLDKPPITHPANRVENEVKMYLVIFGASIYMVCQFPNIEEVGVKWPDETWMHKLWVRSIDNLMDKESEQLTQPDVIGLIDDSLTESNFNANEHRCQFLFTGDRAKRLQQ
jgi:hypothetical protein